MRTRRSIVSGLVLSLLVGTSAWSASAVAAGKPAGKVKAAHPTIVMLNELATDGGFWETAGNGAAKAAKALGDPFSQLDAEAKATRQVSQLKAAMTRHANILIIAPVDSRTLAPYVKQAEAAGIKVCAVGLAEPYTRVDATVTLEEVRGAADDARAILKWAKKAGKKSITVLEGEIGATQEAGRLRTKGFESVMKNPNPYGVKVKLVRKLFGTSLNTVSNALADTLTTTHIDALYSETDFYSPAILAQLKSHGYTTYKGNNHAFWAGTTATPAGISAIKQGWEDYSQNDPIDAQAGTCVRLAQAAYEGKNVMKAIPAAMRAEGLNPKHVLVTNNPKTGPAIQELYQPITRANYSSKKFWPNRFK